MRFHDAVFIRQSLCVFVCTWQTHEKCPVTCWVVLEWVHTQDKSSLVEGKKWDSNPSCQLNREREMRIRKQISNQRSALRKLFAGAVKMLIVTLSSSSNARIRPWCSAADAPEALDWRGLRAAVDNCVNPTVVAICPEVTEPTPWGLSGTRCRGPAGLLQ